MFACSCIGNLTVKQSVKKHDAIIYGTVISRNEFESKDSGLPIGFKSFRAEYAVLVKRAFKGNFQKDTIKVVTGLGGGDCGIKFKLGVNYVIYADYEDRFFESGEKVDSFLTTNICTRTKSHQLKNEIDEIKRCLKIKLNAVNYPFKFEINGIGQVRDSLRFLDRKDDTLGYWEVCEITNKNNEALSVAFVLGGGKFQIQSFQLINISSLKKHRDSLNLFFIDTIPSKAINSTHIISEFERFTFDIEGSLNSTYNQILKTYGKPSSVRTKGKYTTVIYNFTNKKHYENIVESISYYKFLFCNDKLIEVYITEGDE